MGGPAILAHPRRLLAAFGQPARVQGQHVVARAVLLDQAAVHRGQVGEALEVKPHGVLAVLAAVAGQLGEVDARADAEVEHEHMGNKLAAALC